MKNFIFTSTIKPSICDRLIDLYESGLNTLGQPKVTGGMLNNRINFKEKKCKESYYDPYFLIFYLKELKKSLDKYKKEYPWCAKGCPWALETNIKIQKYLPGEAYFRTHYENDGSNECIRRHLTFMTYLNTVKEKGETEWPSQNIKIKPIKGSTVIWPAYFTHPHHGIPAPKETKYIITGWYTYE